MLFDNRDRIVFAGDSVTDAGKTGTTGQRYEGLGKGYVSVLDAILAVAYPDKDYFIYNMGISGNNILHLRDRWDEIMDINPDRLFIFIGINDVWHIYDAPYRELHDINVFKEEYEKLKEIIAD